jgi:hypothetical protein
MIQMPVAIPAVWVYSTTPQYNATRPEGYGAFLSKAQMARLERIRQAQLLFDGRHRELFLQEGRTQFYFPPHRSAGIWGDKIITLYLKLNLSRLISLKSADLLFGEQPLLRVARPAAREAGDDNVTTLHAESDPQRAALESLVERSNLRSLFYNKAVDSSYEAEAYLESTIENGEVFLKEVPAEEIFPIGVPGPDRQYLRYERCALKNIGSESQPIVLMLKTVYVAGSIERHLYQLDEDGKPLPNELDLNQWPLEVGEPAMLPLVRTGIARCTITYIPNFLNRGQAVSDHDGIVELQDELNAKHTQIGRVIAKHADPKLWMPARMADEQGGQRANLDLVFGESKDEIPTYITWNAELAHAITDRDFTREQYLLETEMSPALLGIQKTTSRAASFKAIRLESYNSLTKAQRKAIHWKDGIRRAVSVCQDLEQTLPGVRYDRSPLGVELRDGIPIDELDQANRQSILRAAGVMSTHRALVEQLQDPAAVAEEEAELAKEEAARTPAMNFGAPSAGPGGLEGAPPANEAEAAQAAEQASAEEVAA